MKTRIQQTILAAACLMLVNMLNAQVVTSGADDGTDGTLRVEIADTPNGGEVTFATGVSEVLLTDEIIIDKNITITGNSGDLNIIINAQNTSRHFYVTNSASFVLNNLGLINGQAEDGGAVYLDAADLVATNCQFDSNIADGSSGSGGAVFVDTGGYLEADLCSFTFNRANRAGGAIEDNSGVGLGIVINTSELMNNNTGVAPATAAPGNGGALHITGPGDSEIDNCTIRDNEAAREGGGLWNGSGLMTITDASMIDNIAYGDDAIHGGGALFNNGGVMIVNTSNLSGNSATGVSGSGGGILNLGGDLTVNGGGIISNTANRAGGGIEATDGSMTTLMNVALDNNIAGPDGFAAPGNGGGFHITAGGNAMITDGSVNGNFAGAEGGGLWNGSGTMTVNGTDIMDNVAVGNDADHGGAGLFNVAGILNATGVTVTGNTSTGTAGSGGGTPSLITPSAAGSYGPDWYIDIPVTGFSGFSVGGGDAVLPVELSSFEIAEKENGFQLNWTTASELNNQGFEIERSTDGERFDNIGFVSGLGTSNEENHYSFNDKGVLKNMDYYYRLKQINYDGKSAYSRILTGILLESKALSVSDLMPNPAFDKTSFNLSLLEDERVDIEVFDLSGKLHSLNSYQLSKGLQTVDLDLSNFAPGSYFVKIYGQNQTLMKKLIIH